MTKSTIHICGLGTRPPDETTLETLQVLESCRVVFCDARDPAVYAWLRGYCRALRRPRGAADVAAAARRGGDVGLAVWGHPEFSSALARRVRSEAREAGAEVRVYGAVSPIGSAFARSASFLGGDYGYQGIQAYALETLLADPSVLEPSLPLVVYAESAPAARWRALMRGLARRYPRGHEARVYPANAEESVRALSEAAAEGLDGAVVLVPPPGGPGGPAPR